MKPTFRQSMQWLHTWAGVVLGAVLMAVFWSGTLLVFDREIDRWMAPMTRLPVIETSTPLDPMIRPFIATAVEVGASSITVALPYEREPTLRVSFRDVSGLARYNLDPGTGRILPDPETAAATDFLYRFHYSMHIRFANVGIWLVGLAGMALLALCVSGIAIHRKILADFFTFRPSKNQRRAILDLHNAAGVLGLPFNVVITLSGMIIFYAEYFPSAVRSLYPNAASYYSEIFDSHSRPKSHVPADAISVDTVRHAAQKIWNGDRIQYLVINHPGDAAASMRVVRATDNIVLLQGDTAFFDAATGALLYHRAKPEPVKRAQGFIAGLHFAQFQHWTLRWLYFVLGLSGCVMIATGYVYWVDKRRKRHEQQGLSGVRLVEGLAVGSTTGLIIATLAFFVANRLLPLGTTFLGYERAALEGWAFYFAWIVTFAHAWLRPRRAWIEQCWWIAAFAVAAVLLNGITTGDHLVRSLTHRHLWAIAGMDLLLLAGAMVAALAAGKLQRRAVAPPASSARGRPPSDGIE